MNVQGQEVLNKKKVKRVFAIIALSISIFISIAAAFIFFAVFIPMKNYISEKPFPLEHVPESAEAEKAVSRKMEDFFHRKNQDTLNLNAVELNHLFRGNKKIRQYQIKYNITMDSGHFNIRCTAPVEKLKNQLSGVINFLNLEGFINAEVEGKILLKDDRMVFASTRAMMNGKDALFMLLGKRTHVDLVDFIPNKETYDQILDEIKTISIIQDQLVLVRNGQNSTFQ